MQSSSTFQAVLITDGSSSYAVFIYDCGGMEWGGATIGWAETGFYYEKHYLSGSRSASIGCKYSSNFSAVIYRIGERTIRIWNTTEPPNKDMLGQGVLSFIERFPLFGG